MKKISTLFILLLTITSMVWAEESKNTLPVRGFCIAATDVAQVERFVKFIDEELAPRNVNTLVLRIDYNYQFKSHPEIANDQGLDATHVDKLVSICRKNNIRLTPQINLLGHQSWAGHTGNLLRVYPEFDETPQVKMPEKYLWPNADGLYCKSYCPLHPDLHKLVFELIEEKSLLLKWIKTSYHEK